MKSGGGDNRRPSWKSKEGDHITGYNILSILDRFLDSFQGENVPLAFMSSPCHLLSSPVIPCAPQGLYVCCQAVYDPPRVVPVVSQCCQAVYDPRASSPVVPKACMCAAKQCMTPARRPLSSPRPVCVLPSSV